MGTGIYNITYHPGIFRAFDPSRAILREYHLLLSHSKLTRMFISLRAHKELRPAVGCPSCADWVRSSLCQVYRPFTRCAAHPSNFPLFSVGQFNALSIQVSALGMSQIQVLN